MRIPPDGIIAPEKLTRYLLIPRPADDKSGYLAQAGFNLGNPEALRDAIVRLALNSEASIDGRSEYGEFLRIEGVLEGPRDKLSVVLIWMRRASDSTVHFVTLKPRKER